MDSAAIDDLHRQVHELKAVIAAQKDEIAILKGLKPPPKFPPSRMEDGTDDVREPGDRRSSKGAKRPRNGGERSLRTSDLCIDEDKSLKPEAVPPGSRFKGRKRFVVQDLIL